MQPQHVIAALKELEFTELAEEMEAHQREWESGERPKGVLLTGWRGRSTCALSTAPKLSSRHAHFSRQPVVASANAPGPKLGPGSVRSLHSCSL